MRKLLVAIGVGLSFLLVCLAILEFYLERRGYGEPPLYSYDPAIGYVLQPSQDLKRLHGCKVFINSLGMRAPETTAAKPPGVFRVLVLGDSVPYGGSYIDQEDTFCYVAQRQLNKGSNHYQILNGAVNALGPQNVYRYLKRRGSFGADIVIIYFPWGNLRRDFTNFYIVPFWATSPKWALAEFFRQATWITFGHFSQKWKNLTAFENDVVVEMNLAALNGIRRLCEQKGTFVFFFWSPYRSMLMGKRPHPLEPDIAKLRKEIPQEALIDMTPVLGKQGDIASLYVDDCHYSREGHQVVGRYLAEFIRTRASDLRSRNASPREHER